MGDFFVLLATLSEWAFKIYYWMHIAAIIFSWIRADPHNSVVAFINRNTLPLWNWIHSKVPRMIAPMAPYLALILITFGEFTVPGIIRTLGAINGGNIEMGSGILNMGIYILVGSGRVVDHILVFIMILAVAWFVVTLVNPPLNNPIVQSIMALVDPLITPLQRLLPRSKIDLSPLLLFGIAYITSHLLEQFVINSFAAKLIA